MTTKYEEKLEIYRTVGRNGQFLFIPKQNKTDEFIQSLREGRLNGRHYDLESIVTSASCRNAAVYDIEAEKGNITERLINRIAELMAGDGEELCCLLVPPSLYETIFKSKQIGSFAVFQYLASDGETWLHLHRANPERRVIIRSIDGLEEGGEHWNRYYRIVVPDGPQYYDDGIKRTCVPFGIAISDSLAEIASDIEKWEQYSYVVMNEDVVAFNY